MNVEALIRRGALLVVGLALWGLMSSAAVASSCGETVVRDYEKPLRALPLSIPLPERLPFAPPTLVAQPLREEGERLIYQGSAPGLLLRSEDSQLELNWTARLVVSRITADGSTWPVSEKTTTFGVLPANVSVPALGDALKESGSYRVDAAFFSSSGDHLGSYFDYVQVVARTLEVRLGLTRRAVSPGGTLGMRLENLGTRPITFGFPYVLERYDGQHWKRIPQGPFLMPLRGLQAGEAGECQIVRISRDAQSGKYRVRKEFETPIRFSHEKRSKAKRRQAMAVFRVRRA